MNFTSRFNDLFNTINENGGYEELWSVLAIMHVEAKVEYFNFFSGGNPSQNEVNFFSKYPEEKLLLELDERASNKNKIVCRLKRINKNELDDLNKAERKKFEKALKNIDPNSFDGFIVLHKDNKFVINKFNGDKKSLINGRDDQLVEARNIDDTLNWLFINEFNRERGMGWFLDRSKNVFINLVEDKLNQLIGKIKIDKDSSTKILEMGACFRGRKKHNFLAYPGSASNNYFLFEKMLQNYLTIKVKGYQKDKTWETPDNIKLMTVLPYVLKQSISNIKYATDKLESKSQFIEVMNNVAEYHNEYYNIKTFDFKVIDYLFPNFNSDDLGEKFYKALYDSKIDEKFSVFEDVNLLSKIIPMSNLLKISNQKFPDYSYFNVTTGVLNGFLRCGLLKNAYAAEVKINNQVYINMNYELSDKITDEEFLDIFNETLFEEVRDLTEEKDKETRLYMQRRIEKSYQRETQKVREKFLIKELKKEKKEKYETSVKRKI